MKLQTVAYCRVSKMDKIDDNNNDSNSLSNQREFFTEEINKADWVKGGLILETSCGNNGIYADEGISGTSLKKRTEFNKMLDDGRQNKFDYVITKNVSRWARNVEDTKREIRILKELNIGVYFVTERLDSFDPNADFMISMFASIAQEEARQGSERVKFGLRKSALNGNWGGFAPYGYDTKDKKLVINSDEAKIVEKIYQLYLEGQGTLKITHYLNEINTPTKFHYKNKNKIWYQILVRNILLNPLYTGFFRRHMEEMIDPIAKIKKDVPEAEWITRQDDDIKIIDIETFQKVQDEIIRRSENRIKKTRQSDKYLLSNILYCSACGSGFGKKEIHSYKRKDGTTNDLGNEWTCIYRDQHGKKLCNSDLRPAVKENWVIEEIKKDIKLWQDDKHILMSTADFLYYQKFKLNEEVIKELPEIENSIEETKNDLKSLYYQYSKERISEDFYDEFSKEKTLLLNDLQNKRKFILTLNEQKRQVERKKEEYINLIQKVDTENLTNAILKNLFKKILVYRDSCYIDDDNEEGIILIPVYNFGIDITREEIDEYVDQWVKEDMEAGRI